MLNVLNKESAVHVYMHVVCCRSREEAVGGEDEDRLLAAAVGGGRDGRAQRAHLQQGPHHRRCASHDCATATVLACALH